MNDALKYIDKLLEVLPGLIQAGHDASDLISAGRNMIKEGRDPSDGEWDDLNARIGLMRGNLHSDDE
jgi:hypothetical protein